MTDHADYLAAVRTARRSQLSGRSEHPRTLDRRQAAQDLIVAYWAGRPAPDVEVTRSTPNRGVPGAFVVTITCPYCGAEHTHGIPADGVGGHRVAHCWVEVVRQVNGRGYHLVLPDPQGDTRP